MAGARTAREAALAVGVIAFAGVVWWQTTNIPVSPMYAVIGPTAFAYAVAVALGLLGFALLGQALTGTWGETDAGEDPVPPDKAALGWLVLGLGLNVALIQPLGFVPASILLFCCTARAFGSRRPLRDLAIAVGLSGVAFFGFDRLLGINIGAGVLEGLL